MKYKVLSFTGGSVQGVGLSAIGVGIMETYKPDVIIGESVSAIFAVPLALNKHRVIKDAMMSFTKKDIFGKFPPLGNKDKGPSVRGLFRMLTGKESLGKQDALVKYIKKYLTEDMFNDWVDEQKRGLAARVLVATTNFNTGLLEYFSLSDYHYKGALNIILASCNIPVLINSVNFRGDYHYDGGLIRAQSGTEFLKAYSNDIMEWRSVWNRPNKKRTIDLLSENFTPKSILSVAGRSLKLMIKNESLQAEYIEDLVCKSNLIEHRKYFFETELDSLYDADLSEKIIDWNNGIKIGNNEKITLNN